MGVHRGREVASCKFHKSTAVHLAEGSKQKQLVPTASFSGQFSVPGQTNAVTRSYLLVTVKGKLDSLRGICKRTRSNVYQEKPHLGKDNESLVLWIPDGGFIEL